MNVTQADRLLCGMCGVESYNVIDFLHHKAQHAARNAGVCCELCKMSYTRHLSLREHYQKKHKIVLPCLPLPGKRGDAACSKQDKATENGNVLVADQSQCNSLLSGIRSEDKKQKDVGLLDTDTVHVIVENGQIMPISVSAINMALESHYDKSVKESQVFPLDTTDSLVIKPQNLETFPYSTVSQDSCEAIQEVPELPVNEEDSEKDKLAQEEFPLNANQDTPVTSLQEFSTVATNSDVSAMIQNRDFSMSDISKSSQNHYSSVEPSGIVNMNTEVAQSNVEHNQHSDLVPDMSADMAARAADLENIAKDKSNGFQPTNSLCDSEQSDKHSVHVIVEKSDQSLLDNGHLGAGQEVIGECEPGESDDCKDDVKEPKQGKYKKETLKDDFHFILITDIVVGSSLTYGKQLFRCIHCDFQTYWKTGLCKHMREQHKDTLLIHQALQIKSVNTGDNQSVMKMSEFNALKSAIKNKHKKGRMRGVERQDLIGIHPCPKCDKVFNRQRYLRKHLATHVLDQKFLCDECGKAFKTQSYLKQHRKVHQKSPYRCSQCDFVSTSTAAIQSHRQIHNQQCVLCDICGAAYNTKSTLNKHMKVHDPARKYTCTYPGCTWRFRTEMMCKAHIKNHNTKGKFNCSRCGYAFRHKHHLQRHEASQHGVPIVKASDKRSSEPIQTKEDNNIEEMTDNETVNLIVDPDIDAEHVNLQNALQNSQLVIATDSDGNTINYEVAADITMNVAYQTLLPGTDGQMVDTHAILIPQSSDCSHIVIPPIVKGDVIL